jgi:hypothetical protein
LYNTSIRLPMCPMLRPIITGIIRPILWHFRLWQLAYIVVIMLITMVVVMVIMAIQQ